MRKPISIAITNSTEFELASTVVICDDGTIWELSRGFWEPLPDVPQDQEEEEK
jgi:hypothetical protein